MKPLRDFVHLVPKPSVDTIQRGIIVLAASQKEQYEWMTVKAVGPKVESIEVGQDAFVDRFAQSTERHSVPGGIEFFVHEKDVMAVK